MNWFFYHGKVDDNYGWELDLFHRIRDSSDGFTAIEFKANFDKYPCDHNPRFELSLIVCNFIIFDFEIYNLWHLEHEQSPFYQKPNENMKATFHSREKFYGKEIYWYSFDCDEANIPIGFLRVTETPYYEFGGTFDEALARLALFDVKEGNPI